MPSDSAKANWVKIMSKIELYKALELQYKARRDSDKREELIGTILFGALFLQVLGTIIYSLIR